MDKADEKKVEAKAEEKEGKAGDIGNECEGGSCPAELKLKELESHFKVLAAEFDNYRKRVEKEKGEIVSIVERKVFLDLISINDVLETALKVQRQSKDESSIKGFEMVYSEFQKVLKKYRVEKQVVLGKKFNPSFHNAVTALESEKEDDIILEEVQPGYLFNGQVLRPAMVVVSKKV